MCITHILAHELMHGLGPHQITLRAEAHGSVTSSLSSLVHYDAILAHVFADFSGPLKSGQIVRCAASVPPIQAAHEAHQVFIRVVSISIGEFFRPGSSKMIRRRSRIYLYGPRFAYS